MGIDKIGTRKVGQREKYSEKSTRRKVRLEKWVTKWGVKSEPRKVGDKSGAKRKVVGQK